MISNWDVTLDVASIIIIVVLLALYFSRRVFNNKKNYYYLGMLIIAFLSSFFSIISSYIDKNIAYYPLYLVYFFNIVYVILIYVNIIMFFSYAIILIRKEHFKKIEYFIFRFCIVAIILSISTTFIHKKIFYIENNTYLHGSLFNYLFYLVIIIALYCGGIAFINRKKIKAMEMGIIVSFLVMTVISYILLVVNPVLIFVDFAMVIVLMMLYATIENPDYYYDKELNIYNYYALEHNLQENNYQSAIVLTICKYDYFKTKYQNKIDYKKASSKVITECLEKYVSIKNIFVTKEKNYIILLKENGLEVAKKILIDKAKNQRMDDVSFIEIDFYLTHIKLLFDINKSLETINYTINNHGRLMLNHINKINYSQIDGVFNYERFLYDFDRKLNNKDIEILLKNVYSLEKKQVVASKVTFRLPNIKNNEQIVNLFEQDIVGLDKMIFDKVLDMIISNRYKYKQVNITISFYALLDINFIEHIIRILNDQKFKEYQFNFILNEVDFVYNKNKLKSNISKLKNKGCLIVFDDYGTGINNIENILDFGFNGIRIDGSLLIKMIKQRKVRILNIQGELFKRLEIKTFVKGISSKKIYDALNLKNIDYIEGDYIENS